MVPFKFIYSSAQLAGAPDLTTAGLAPLGVYSSGAGLTATASFLYVGMRAAYRRRSRKTRRRATATQVGPAVLVAGR